MPHESLIIGRLLRTWRHSVRNDDGVGTFRLRKRPYMTTRRSRSEIRFRRIGQNNGEEAAHRMEFGVHGFVNKQRGRNLKKHNSF